MRHLTTCSSLKSNFFETRAGVCRVVPPLTEALAATALECARLVAPDAERAAGLLLAAPMEGPSVSRAPRSGGTVSPAAHRTPLTGRNRRRRPGNRLVADSGVSPALTAALPHRCKECGADLGRRTRALCDACLESQPARASAKAVAVQQRLRAAGADGRSSEEARAKHRANAERQAAELAAWRAVNPVTPNPQRFREEIWPALRGCSTAAIRAATGLSESMSKKVRTGDAVPDPRHWDTLRALAGVTLHPSAAVPRQEPRG